MSRGLKIAITIYLWLALLEDSILFVLSWLAPNLWFQLFHNAMPTVLATAFLRRSGGQWAAFALGQAITLMCWRKNPVWLAVAAGLRFSDLFTDICYIIAVPSLTLLGWGLLTPPPVLNLVGVIILLRGYLDTTSRRAKAHK
jgi:hypothetical protein